MSRNVEELLREGIDRLALDADAVGPATLLHRARQHNRRRRQAMAAAIAAGTAAVTAAAVIIATAGTAGSNAGALHGQTITYVATRAEQALDHLDQSHAIEIDTITTRNGAFGFTVLNTAVTPTGNPQVRTVLSTVHASSEVDWTYNGSLLQQGYSGAGKLVYTSTEGAQGLSGAAYPAHVRWHNPLTGGQSGPGPALSCDNAGFDYPNWKQSLRKALSCHLFTLSGDQLVDGIETIKLIAKPVTAEGQTFRQTLWVDPKTYLPLRITTVVMQSHRRAATMTDNFRWQSPTKTNLAGLHAAEERGTIPASYRSLPSTYAPLPGFEGPSK
jgi:hypothetical protein